MAATARPTKLPYTGNEEADRLLAEDPLALLIGFVLDQQVTLQKAFSGPFDLRRRVGTLDVAELAAMDIDRLDAAFRERPALHRFPSNMARRTQALCEAIVRDYGGDAASVWRDAKDGKDLERRLLSLPGIGEMKARGRSSGSSASSSGSSLWAGKESPPSTGRSATWTHPRHWPHTRPASAPTRPRCAPMRPTMGSGRYGRAVRSGSGPRLTRTYGGRIRPNRSNIH